MKLDAPRNNNYAAQVVRVNKIVELGLTNLVGIPALGHQALTTRGVQEGDLVIVFTSETQLTDEYAGQNSLFREVERNVDPDAKGYLEKNGRIRAIKLGGQRSNALLMPLSSVEYTGIDWLHDLHEGDTFDTINGHEICRKYEVPVKPGSRPQKSKIEKAFKRVDAKLFPEHLSTDNFWRNRGQVDSERDCIVTQKLHGTSIRVGNVPVLRQKKWFEKFINRWFPTPDYEYDVVYGSRKVIKDANNPNQNHYYQSDIWTEYGAKIADLIPEGFLLYGELIGWTTDGAALQKNYTYDVPKGSAELYVYRVARINGQGLMTDLSWDGVKEFCMERGLKWCPELTRVTEGTVDEVVERLIDVRLFDHGATYALNEDPIQLSDKKSVDEGVCIRQEGLVPLILKAKSPAFLEHETKLLDKGEADLESLEAA